MIKKTIHLPTRCSYIRAKILWMAQIPFGNVTQSLLETVTDVVYQPM